MVILLMGVSGSGKTTLGRALAEELDWSFCDADWHHPPASVEKMRSGVPLTEADRLPWLEVLAGLVREWVASGTGAVLACSALSARSRQILCQDDTLGAGAVRVVYLRGTREVIRERLEGRGGHFMPPALLDSQFEALEEPRGALVVDIDRPPADIVRAIRAGLPVG